LTSAGEIAAIMIVLEFPPSAFYSILVNFDSLYGTTTFIASFLPAALSARILMTFPRKLKDLLILEPSACLYVSSPIVSALSEPAKSTMFILLSF